MNLHWRILTLFLGLGLALMTAGPGSAAGGPQLYGTGVVRANPSGAEFWIQLDDGVPLSFGYLDYASQPARAISLQEGAIVTCLGEMFGGPAVRLDGSGWDSASPAASVAVQLFLVDGLAGARDRLSLKVRTADGDVSYFLPMRDLESGELLVNCPG